MFGGHLEQARGSAQQSGCRGGIDSQLTPHLLPVTSQGLVPGALIEAPKAALQRAPGSPRRERAQVQGTQVLGPRRARCAPGELPGRVPRPAPGIGIATRHSSERPGSTAAGVPGTAQAGVTDPFHPVFALPDFRWGTPRRAVAAQRRAVAPPPEETSQEVRRPRWPEPQLLRRQTPCPHIFP